MFPGILRHVMSTFHTQQQFLCQLESMRMKKKPLVQNAVLSDTETNKLAHPLHFQLSRYHYLNQYKQALICFCFNLILSTDRETVIRSFTIVVKRKRVYLRDYIVYLIFLLKRVLVTRLRISCIFSWQEKHLLKKSLMGNFVFFYSDFFHFFIRRKAFRKFLNCCFIFHFGSSRWVVLCKRKCFTKSYSRITVKDVFLRELQTQSPKKMTSFTTNFQGLRL